MKCSHVTFVTDFKESFKLFHISMYELYIERERLCFINRHFAELTELRDFAILIVIMVKTSIKSNMTICKLIDLRDKNAFNCTFSLRHTCLQRSPRISLFGKMVGQTSFLSLNYIRHYSVSVVNPVIYFRDRSQLTETLFR